MENVVTNWNMKWVSNVDSLNNFLAALYKYHHHPQNSPFWATTFLSRFCQIWHPVHFFGCCSSNFFYRARSSTLHPIPQPGGLGPCIYVPQWQGSPVITPDIGFPFTRSYLLQLAGLQWRYSKPPPQGNFINILSHDWVWLETGFGLVIRFIGHLQLQITMTVSLSYTLQRSL
jgi:hypothetical protein